MAEWIDRMRGVDVGTVAGALGYACKASGSSITVSPCPACKAERRRERKGEKRGPVSFRKSNPAGWKCHVCETTGDALHFVALALCGRKLGALDEHDRARVRDWCATFAGGSSSATSSPRTSYTPQSCPAPTYPPAEELRKVWREYTRPVTYRGALRDWLVRERGLDPAAIASGKLARELDEWCDRLLPPWAHFESGGGYASRGFRLVVPMYDVAGGARSLIFRRMRGGEGPKSVPPRGFERTGLVMACGLARVMLHTGEAPRVLGAPVPLVIAEGEMAFLKWATAAASPCAVFGIVSGSWTPTIAARVPNGVRVVIATDHDQAGIDYAKRIIDTLAERARSGAVVLERWKGAARAS